MQTLDARKTQGLSLFAQGYRVRAATERVFGSFLVTKPDGVTQYLVQPLRGYCSCPASTVCKHLLGLERLIVETWCEEDDSMGRAWSNYALMQEWDEVKALQSERELNPGSASDPVRHEEWRQAA